ncbi:MAG: DUF3606 domain-containing protein [Dokdonella sp.]|uniref:DUF3606 domain-containing protein n=1 Tax=Dokdonella sp. TaxID=2291710 RepID=UPI003264006F
MTDDLKPSGEHVFRSNLINIHDEGDVRYWTEKLGCTSDELKIAVLGAGAHVPKVREWMGKNWNR